MSIINVGGNDYKVGRLNVMQQHHVGRRLAPLIFLMGEKAVGLLNQDGSVNAESTALASMAPMAGMVADILSRMSDEDSERVIFECMSVVQRAAGRDAWQVVVAQGRFMFEDIQLPELYRLVFGVIWEHMPDFFKEHVGNAHSTGS